MGRRVQSSLSVTGAEGVRGFLQPLWVFVVHTPSFSLATLLHTSTDMANGVARVKGVYEAEANLQLPRLLREREAASIPDMGLVSPQLHRTRALASKGEKVGTLTLLFVREGGDGDVGAYVVQVRAAGKSKAGHGLCKVFSVAALALGIIISPPNFAVLQCPDAVTTSLPRGRGQPRLGATHDVRTWEFYGRTLPSTIAGRGAGTVCVGERASAVDIFWGKHLKEGREVLRNRQHSHVGSDV
ncbi:hypothetical protein BD779DRAFT_1481667 [Infundibulicybe gibba]|nr:hypothetical protein BD779DRAFT_1481667 [Infundibulicybe gibba]